MYYLPISMIVYTGTSSRYMAMSVSDLIKCVPRYFELKPNFVSYFTEATANKKSINWVPVTWFRSPSENIILSVVSLFVPE